MIKQEIALPEALLASEIRFGFEGIARDGDVLWMPVQRPWKDDAKGEVKLVSYNIESEEWGAVRYPLDAPADKGWVGLSDIAFHGDHAYIVERDNQIGDKAAIKKIYRVADEPAYAGGAGRGSAAGREGRGPRPDAGISSRSTAMSSTRSKGWR